jgi:tetratricopeptide (TPR) repeat protein
LCNALRTKGDLAGAIIASQVAVRLDPTSASAYGAKGQTLQQQGRFAEAKSAFQQALLVLQKNHPLREAVMKDTNRCDRLIELENKLPTLLKEAEQKDPNALSDFAKLLHYKQRYAASARFYAAAFLANGKVADGVDSNHNYQAARAAARAAAGRDADAADLDDAGRASLRQHCLDWLRTQLEAWSDLLKQDAKKHRLPVLRAMNEWRSVIDLATVRDDVALANLPTAERHSWQQFWAEVDSLVKRAQGE